jgi:hypothetical protein
MKIEKHLVQVIITEKNYKTPGSGHRHVALQQFLLPKL